MLGYPNTVLDFEERFATEEACRQYLLRLRWPEGISCLRCGSWQIWSMQRAVYWCGQCDYQFSVTAGTLFHDTRKPLRLWFRAIWYVVNQKQGVSALGLQRVLGLGSYRTAWTWLHKLRRGMVRPGRERLSGTVEMDETYVGGAKPGKRGRGADGKTLVVVAVEDRTTQIGRIRLLRVAEASAKSLVPAVQTMVEPGSRLRTDGWRSYRSLGATGYGHTIVRPQANVGDNLLPLVNRVVALLKTWLQGTHQGAVHPAHLDYYLDEFTFRFNRRTSCSQGKLFARLVEQAVAMAPITGQNIRGGRPLA